MSRKNDNLVDIQDMIMEEMKRLSDSNYMDAYGKDEIARANALGTNATVFLKSVNLGIRILDISNKFEIKENELKTKLGIKNDK